jgi:hypothetical protein
MVAKNVEVMNRLQQNGVFPDRLIRKKDGSFEFRKMYFYRHGQTTEQYVSAILRVYPQAKIVDQGDEFHHWPKDSYFMVRFKI